ncbi:hypothetical protein, partial [Pseudomonas sp. NPDC085632]|uniref:hypothetical protein n=1 Tax=Pseudomonas sp. NPDC085632 TaxID=3364429 RepID=UPI0037C935D9
EHPGGEAFLSFVNAWIELAGMLNELSRIMANSGVVSEAFARGHLQLTALCELALNVCLPGE